MCKIIIFSILLFFFLVLFILYNIYIERISAHSQPINRIEGINKRYFFYDDIKLRYSILKICESKRLFDRFDYSAFLMQIIHKELNEFESLIKKIEDNISSYRNYRSEFFSVGSNPTLEDAIKAKVPLFFYKKLEPILLQKLMIEAPVQTTSIGIHIRYTSPKGRNRYFDYHIFNFHDIKKHIKSVKRGIENAKTKEFQRSLMTDSLRYDILHRDGFTCQLCGTRRQDGARLHVDHIFPVSRGGRTVESNLRTLCARCNRGKGAKIETR